MTEYGCLEFITRSSPTSESDGGSDSGTDMKLIIGVVVGVVLLVIIIIIVIIIICLVRSRRRKSQVPYENSINYNDLRARERNDHAYDNVTNTSRAAASGTGTTRSFLFGSEHMSVKPQESVTVNQY